MLDVNHLFYSSKEYFILVGKNGSGKSRLLHELAENLHDSGCNVIAVSNTLFDKFKVHVGSLNYDYIGSRLGRDFPAKAIKRTLSTKNEGKISRVFSVLKHILYEEKIGIKVKFRGKFKDAIRYSLDKNGRTYPVYFDSSTQNIPDELMMAVDKAMNKLTNGLSVLEWLENNGNVFYEGNFDSYLTLLRFEGVLKKANIISGIDIFLSKNGVSFPLSQASSGELSFIALLVHVAFCANDSSYIFIDEPENSLHPRWQNEYFDLLRGAIGYNKCRVVVATHSPLIISSISESTFVEIYKRKSSGFERVSSYDDNAEELYIDYFDTLTPKNRALSNRCVDIIDAFTDGRIDYADARTRLSVFKLMAKDAAQQDFISGVEALLETVSNKKKAK
ncbi:AAA family ATPase [Hafnia alvei]|uniref:AAA domain-containing protein, putative AbiEii toxin, Type IV TA system n=1 Tax=Hafnia alvei TaxID=569 RepID=A0A1C6Z3V5_HAFAL|nr:ATP-binding protein [Hafnia alvei]NLS55671.1 AAA family ATPase [Hafnia alvei]SCM53725.1 AAA domain-containing protein, putative AbiEii toxin, Type IV TA system [Hafnia alvei]